MTNHATFFVKIFEKSIIIKLNEFELTFFVKIFEKSIKIKLNEFELTFFESDLLFFLRFIRQNFSKIMFCELLTIYFKRIKNHSKIKSLQQIKSFFYKKINKIHDKFNERVIFFCIIIQCFVFEFYFSNNCDQNEKQFTQFWNVLS